MRRHLVPGQGGHARVTPALAGAGVVIELFGPQGGFLAGLGFDLEAAPALVKAFRESRRDGEALRSELSASSRWAEQVLERDTEVRCPLCSARASVSFARSLADGWPACCGESMVLARSSADVGAAVRMHVTEQLLGLSARELAEASP